MARFDRDQSNHSQHSSVQLARGSAPSTLPPTEGDSPGAVWRYGRGVRSAWGALALTLLLTTVSLLAHDSAQQPVTSAPPTPSVTTTPLIAASPRQTAPGAVATSGANPDFDAAVPTAAPVAIIDAPGRQSTPPSTPTLETGAFTALRGRSAGSIPVANTPATPPAAHPNMLGGGAEISPSAVSSIPIAVAATSSAAVQLAAHPRLILDANTLTTLRQSAANNSAQWQTLKATCDSFIGGTVQYPTGTAYPDLPNAGQGYEGDAYLPALLAEGMCYQVLKVSNPTAAAPYGAKAVDLLMKMSTPVTSSGNLGEDPCTDDGYVMRFYGVGFGLGYDWVYELLTPAQRTQVYTTANAWITAWEAPNGCADFEYANPQSNYFAGYFHAKAAIALATYDENPSAPAEWTDWLTNQFAKRVQPYYAQHLTGGGWPEGFANYAPLGIVNMSLPAREVMTATGQDLVHATAPYSYPLDSANYAMHFTWPSLTYFDDRDTNHSNSTTQPPGTTQVGMFQQILGELTYWNSPQASVFNQYLTSVNAATSGYGTADPWLAFLEVNPAAAVTPLNTLPLSYFASGMGAVAARSDWGTSASWMSFRAGPYINNPDQGEEYFDQGSLALVHGGTPLLLNATGWVVHNPNGTAGENDVYNDNYGSFTPSNDGMGNRRPYNIFYVRHMNGTALAEAYGQAAYTTESNAVRTQVSAYEDGSDYVYTLATHLEDMYRQFAAGPAVAGWAREVVYLRPNRFVVYDRTTSGSTGYDQFLAWHFPASPVAGTAAAGQNRFDVTYNGQYAGAMTTVLPVSATTTTAAMYTDATPVKAWEIQVRAPNTNVSQQWLNVFDMSASATAVAATTPVTVTQGGIVGVQLTASDGNSVVVSSTGPAGTPISGNIGYSVADVTAHHVITGLAPNTGYTIVATVSGSVQSVSISVGGSSMNSSSEGVLDFNLSASGVVSTPPIIVTLPISILPVPGYPQPYTGS